MAARREGGGRTAVLRAADRLFYEEGIGAVSIDRVAREAGLTKRAVYYHFPDKPALVAAYLERAHDRSLGILRSLGGNVGTGRERLGRMFGGLTTLFSSPQFRGCAMLTASAQSDAGRDAAAAYQEDLADWLAAALSEDGTDEAEVKRTARRLRLLLNGAMIEATLGEPSEVAEVAARMAARLLDG